MPVATVLAELPLSVSLLSSAPTALPPHGAVVWSVGVSGGISHEIAHSIDDLKLFAVSGGVSRQVSDRIALGVELVPMQVITGHVDGSRHMPGFNLLARAALTGSERGQLVVETGAGMLFFGDPFPREGGVKLNFSLLVGLSWEYAISAGRGLSVGYRLHHISNSGRGDVNPGINASELTLGLRFWSPEAR